MVTKAEAKKSRQDKALDSKRSLKLRIEAGLEQDKNEFVRNSKQLLFIKQLKLNPENAQAWFNLGANLVTGGMAKVGSHSYTKKQCYVQALTLYPKYVEAWHNLGVDLGVEGTAQIGSQSYTELQCYAQAVTLNPEVAESWFNLGHDLGDGETAQFRNQSYTQQQCYVRCGQRQRWPSLKVSSVLPLCFNDL